MVYPDVVTIGMNHKVALTSQQLMKSCVHLKQVQIHCQLLDMLMPEEQVHKCMNDVHVHVDYGNTENVISREGTRHA